MRLTSRQRDALMNLAQKRDGAPVAFINIGDALTLTQLGLARRTHQGWVITDEGTALLAAAEVKPAPGGTIAPFPTGPGKAS